ncbi:MAG: energy-coupling factor ABC transporter permease [Thiohalobacteraceae bacterium]
MNFPGQVFPTALHIFGYLGALVWLFWALRHLRWERLRENAFTHVYFGACVGALLLWSLQAGMPPTLHFHLLGVTVLTLMFGWRLAALAVTLILLGATVNGQGSWQSFGINLLAMGAVPIALSSALLHVAQRRLPHNFFIYIYINAFLAAGASILGTSLIGVGLLWLTGTQTLAWLGYHYVPYFPLMAFSEAVLNGMVMTLLVTLRPGWVSSFDDNLYINGK